MPNCFTCNEEITFDKNILSKTGKQIPLWPDKQNAHGHDKETGKPIRQPLPTQNLSPQQTQQFNQYNRQPNFPPPLEQQPARIKPSTGYQATGHSQGGSYLDTKRIRVMLEEVGKKLFEHEEILNSIYQLSRNNMAALATIMDHFKLTEPTTAAALYQQKQQPKEEEEEQKVYGWNSIPDKIPTKTKTKLVDESKQDFPIEETLKDDDDDDVDSDENLIEKKGVIDDL